MEIIETPFNDKTFNYHLRDNKQILFSGQFGAGKSNFLRRYFEKNPEYHCIILKPVNYSSQSNKDIFELLKYELLYKLISFLEEKEPDGWEKEIAKENLLKEIIEVKPVSFAQLIKGIPETGNSVISVIKTVYELYKAIREALSSTESTGTTADKYETFINEIESSKGSIFERDFYTKLIEAIVSYIRRVYDRKMIWVIDDLDRLDPENLFRILNILSAHTDIETNKIKFGFDRLIIVCDYKSLERIYYHRYGDGTNFDGYISKFHSSRPFEFDLAVDIEKKVKPIITDFIIKRNGMLPDGIKVDNELINVLVTITVNLFLHDKVRIKDIKDNLITVHRSYTAKEVHFINRRLNLPMSKFRFFTIYYYLIILLNSEKRALKVLNEIRTLNNVINAEEIRLLLMDLASLLHFRYNPKDEERVEYKIDYVMGTNTDYKTPIRYELFEGSDEVKNYIYAAKEIKIGLDNANFPLHTIPSIINYFNLLYWAFDLIDKKEIRIC
jgi:hypothetical protein